MRTTSASSVCGRGCGGSSGGARSRRSPPASPLPNTNCSSPSGDTRTPGAPPLPTWPGISSCATTAPWASWTEPRPPASSDGGGIARTGGWSASRSRPAADAFWRACRNDTSRSSPVSPCRWSLSWPGSTKRPSPRHADGVTRVRFDDLTPGEERAFGLCDLVGVVEARRPEDVPAAIGAVEEAAAGGLWAAGYVAYEAARGLNPDLRVPRGSGDPPLDLPLVWFGIFERRIQLDPLVAAPSPKPPADPAWAPSVDRARYDAAVERIRELIAAGEVYQVNHTLRLRARVDEDPIQLYRRLCLAQRSRYSAFLDIGGHLVLSASPELFLQIESDRILVRPMKGTAPRGRWPAEDRRAAQALLASDKDRAENAMIVDLLRNDLGRVARPGTVEVTRLFEVERYETVWQLTSTIAARLSRGLSLLDVFRALFPSGSVTGAPKLAAMRIIADLEDSPRGVYTGAVGFVAPAPTGGVRAAFNVAIRTLILETATGLA